jgi:hypothetical protein
LDFRQFRQFRQWMPPLFSKRLIDFFSVLAVACPSREKTGFTFVAHERVSIDLGLGYTKRNS